MIEFLQNQTDYFLFLISIGYFALGLFSYFISQKEKGEALKVPWFYLGFFGVVHGLGKGLDIISLSFVKNDFLNIARVLAVSLSYLLLTEYIRQGIKIIFQRNISKWFYLPFILGVVLISTAGSKAAGVEDRILALAGAIASGFITYKFSLLLPRRKNIFLHLGILFVLNGLVDLVMIFYSGIIIDIVKALIALAVLAICWNYLERSMNDEIFPLGPARANRKSLLISITLMLAVLTLTWFGVYLAGNMGQSQERGNFLIRARTVASSINVNRIKSLKGNESDTFNSDFIRLREQLAAIHAVNKDTSFVYLLGYNQGKVIFLADAEPEKSKDYSAPGEVYDQASQQLKQTFENGQDFTEGPLRDKWGNWVSALIAIKDPNTGNVTAVLGMDIDTANWNTKIYSYRLFAIALVLLVFITIFAVLTVRAMQLRERYLELIVNGISDPVILATVESKNTFRILLVNRPFVQITGISNEKIIGKSFQEIFNAGKATKILNLAEKALENEKIVGSEMFVKFPSGQYFYDVKIIPFRYRDGDCTHILVTGHDITERKEAEEALRKSEERLRQLINSAPLGIVTCDLAGNITNANAAMLAIVASPSEEDTRNFNVLTFPLMVEAGIADSFRRCMENGELVVSEHRYTSHWGNKVYARLHVSPLHGPEGNITGAQAIVEDFTERKELEEELLKAGKIESIGVLAGGIAHDFNNLMTVILGNVSLAKTQVNPEDKLYRRLSEVEKASIQATNMTQQLLTFAKGGAPIVATISVADLIRDTVNFALSGSNVKCEFTIPDGLWAAEIDEGQISQVINNMIINATQAMPEGGLIKVAAENITVNKAVHIPAKEGNYIKITIADQGIGIPEEHLSKVFDPYFTTKQKGNGLGLATSYSIIKKHNGHIAVESQLGVGTVFSIYLPATPEAVINKPGEADKVETGKGYILLMDDEEAIREITGSILQSYGYEVDGARDGQEAIEMYQKALEAKRPYDVVIMDLTVPGGMGGKEAVKKLAEIDPSLKAIVSSGYSNDAVMADFRSYGFSGVVAKPYKGEDLARVVHDLIAGEANQ